MANMNLHSLFEDDLEMPGFRLHHVEICNWGVFDKKIYCISPKGETTLLTGANGAGKTTYVEALLTLLVPEQRMRRYNQASGATTRKDERNEMSYVMGEIGMKNGGEGATSHYLRDNKSKTQSYLLAVFFNGERYVTLAQVRWFSGSEMRRMYIVGRTKLSLTTDFKNFETSGVWTRSLKKNYGQANGRNVIETFDTPGKYAQTLRSVLGMKSEKALSLFSQTIGLKVLGDLNEFIRTNMLESSSVEQDFEQLKEGLNTLLHAHDQILKAEKQIELIKPIIELNNSYEKTKANVAQFTAMSDYQEAFFMDKKLVMLEKELNDKKYRLDVLNDQLAEINSRSSLCDEELIKIKTELERSDIGSRINSLTKRIGDLNSEIGVKKKSLESYNDLATILNLDKNPDFEIFELQKKLAQEKLIEIDELQEENTRKRFQLDQRIEEDKQKEGKTRSDIEYLLNNKNNITGRVAEIRQEILLAVGASEQEIPFVGELIQVEEGDKDKWQFAIEKVLHNFALQLIVPEEFYEKVTAYVNNNNLRGRLIYNQYKSDFRVSNESDFEDSLYSKLKLNVKSDYSQWVEDQLLRRFNYLCTDDLDLFRRSDKALTSKGLTKNDKRHEKDDREKTNSKSNYVLGWDNKEKIESLRSCLKNITSEIKEQESILVRLQKEKTNSALLRNSTTNFCNFESYSSLDYHSSVIELSQKEKELKELEKDASLDQLKKQCEILESRKKDLQANWKSKSNDINKIEIVRDEQNRELNSCKELLEIIDFEVATPIFALISERFPRFLQNLSLATFETTQKQVSKELSNILDNENKAKYKIKGNIESKMNQFINPSLEIAEQFKDWKNDVHLLVADAEYIGDYLSYLKKIEKEQLVESKKRFKKYLNEDMEKRMISFGHRLEQQKEDIVKNIDALNESLSKICFRQMPNTYIQLIRKDETAERIKAFKVALKDWRPNIAQKQMGNNEQIAEQTFLKIKKLIQDLSDNPDYRKLVTDVRNWMSFEAQEITFEDRISYKTYKTTAKLSGGEKAQLTYTILGSALAYQFGISENGKNANSFRFICIDESFSNQDAEKADYLMKLCNQLHLQLLCVTPEDKTNIVEPHISSIHYVYRKNDRNADIIDMPISKFIEQRENYKTNNA